MTIESENPHGCWPRTRVTDAAWFIPMRWGGSRTVAHFYSGEHAERDRIPFPLPLCRPLMGLVDERTGEPVVFAPGNAPRCQLCDRKLNRTRRSQ